jgi:zinc and cadmium transporter
MMLFITLSLYCLVIVAASILGGYVPLLVRMTHTRMQMMMSFIAGLMLGVSFFHLLPHAIEEMHSVDDAVLWMTGGFVAMLLLLRAFHFHQHEPVPLDAGGQGHDHALPGHDPAHAHAGHDEHEHSHAGHEHHEHGHHGHDHHGHGRRPRMNWVGIAIGMSIHTLIDGVALAANVVAETEEVGPRLLVGMGTFLAIALHKPLDSLSITSIMTAGGWSVAARHWANVVFSLMCPLGCAVFVLGIHQVVEQQHVALGAVLGLSAGGFLCISVADLMPELELHSHDRFRLSLALVLGVGLAYAVHLIEPAHEHEHGHAGEHVAIKISTAEERGGGIEVIQISIVTPEAAYSHHCSCISLRRT